MEEQQQGRDVTSSRWLAARTRGVARLARLARVVPQGDRNDQRDQNDQRDRNDQGDQNDQEDGVLTVVLFVAVGLCILMVLAEFRA